MLLQKVTIRTRSYVAKFVHKNEWSVTLQVSILPWICLATRRKVNRSLLLAHTVCHVGERRSDVSVVGRRSSTTSFQVIVLGFIFPKKFIKLYLIKKLGILKGEGYGKNTFYKNYYLWWLSNYAT